MPAWGALIAYSMGLPPEMAVGLILVASCPGQNGLQRGGFFGSGKGRAFGQHDPCLDPRRNLDDPLLTSWYAGHYLPVDPWALFKGIIMVVLLPLTVGVGWNRFFAKSARKASAYSPLVSVLLILLIVGFVLAAKRTLILENWVTLLLSVLFLHAGAFFWVSGSLVCLV